MGRVYGYGNKKTFAERKARKINNLIQQHPNFLKSDYFNLFNTKIKEIQTEQFRIYLEIEFINFKHNLRYVQKCSGYNQDEFCRIVGLSKTALTFNHSFPTTIPIHTFKKAFGAMLYFLPSIEFCDMFNLIFSDTFPFLKDTEQNNRLKLGKNIRKPYTYKTT